MPPSGPKRRLPGRARKVSLREVARAAEVSQSTVSRIMRGTPVVAEETRARVMAAAGALGYVPNRIAGALASLDPFLMGVVIPSLSNAVFPEVLQGIQAGLEGSGLQAVVSTTDYDPAREEAMVRGILSLQPAAILIAGLEHTAATRRMLEGGGLRVVEMMDIDAVPVDVAVGASHRGAGLATGRHLIAKGYRRFGYVGHDWAGDGRARARHEGLCAALAEAGLALVAEARAEGPSSVGAGREMAARLRAAAPGVEVAVCSNDDMAVGAVFHALAAGLRLPEDFAVFGFNGLEIGRALPQPLSTLRTNRFEIGRRSVAAILGVPDRPGRPLVIDTGFEIVVGATA